MPASGGIKLPDANVWLAVAFSDHVHHLAAKAWFDVQSEESQMPTWPLSPPEAKRNS